MKRIVSISLGSSRRDHKVSTEFCGQSFRIERIGTDGNRAKAIELIRQLDGQVDAFGLGGADLYIYAGNRRYTFRESAQIVAAAQKTPIVDGSGLKNTLERRIIDHLASSQDFSFRDKHILVMCAVDRFGLAESLVQAGGKVIFGDLLFGLGLNVPIRTLTGLARWARVAAPFVTQLPIHWFYPVGSRQTENTPRFTSYFDDADVIAGDFHFIRRYMPQQIKGKTVITNTITTADVAMLRDRGAAALITTSPDMEGRSFGTNVLEAIVVAYSGKKPQSLTALDYERLIEEIGVKPQVIKFS